jgi:endonuclease IV
MKYSAMMVLSGQHQNIERVLRKSKKEKKQFHFLNKKEDLGIDLFLRLTKKFMLTPHSRITKWAQPKENIRTCLDCGHYHENGTICTNCYNIVKEETEKLQAKIDKYNHPVKEIKFKYLDDRKKEKTETDDNRQTDSDEEEEEDDKKIEVIELDSERPTWFKRNLTTKVKSIKIEKQL